MDSLPIKFLTDEDILDFGSLTVSLGKLARAGLPVVDEVVTAKKLKVSGSAFYDPLDEDVKIEIKSGKVHPKDLKKIMEIVLEANKNLFIPHVYDWIVDLPAGRQGGGVKLIGLSPYTPRVSDHSHPLGGGSEVTPRVLKAKSAVKVYLDLKEGLVIEKEVDGVYIDIPDSDESTYKLVEAAITFSPLPILYKLGNLQVLDFVRHKKGLNNIHIVVPSVRALNEFIQIKRELATKKLMRKHSLELWLELGVPENIINLEDYLLAGLDGVLLNLDQILSHLLGFDLRDEEKSGYKKEIKGLLKFLEDGIKLLHKSKIPFLAIGSISLDPEVLDFLVEKGVYGIVVERFEAHSAKDLLHLSEKRMILRKVVID